MPDEVTTDQEDNLKVKKGTLVTFTITVPEEKEGVETLTVNGENYLSKLEGLTFKVEANSDIEVLVTFKESETPQETLTHKLVLPEKITSDQDDNEKVLEGAEVVLTISVPENQKIASLKVNNVEKKEDVLENTYTFTMPSEDVLVLVEFEYEDVLVKFVVDEQEQSQEVPYDETLAIENVPIFTLSDTTKTVWDWYEEEDLSGTPVDFSIKKFSEETTLYGKMAEKMTVKIIRIDQVDDEDVEIEIYEEQSVGFGDVVSFPDTHEDCLPYTVEPNEEFNYFYCTDFMDYDEGDKIYKYIQPELKFIAEFLILSPSYEVVAIEDNIVVENDVTGKLFFGKYNGPFSEAANKIKSAMGNVECEIAFFIDGEEISLSAVTDHWEKKEVVIRRKEVQVEFRLSNDKESICTIPVSSGAKTLNEIFEACDKTMFLEEGREISADSNLPLVTTAKFSKTKFSIEGELDKNYKPTKDGEIIYAIVLPKFVRIDLTIDVKAVTDFAEDKLDNVVGTTKILLDINNPLTIFNKQKDVFEMYKYIPVNQISDTDNISQLKRCYDLEHIVMKDRNGNLIYKEPFTTAENGVVQGAALGPNNQEFMEAMGLTVVDYYEEIESIFSLKLVFKHKTRQLKFTCGPQNNWEGQDPFEEEYRVIEVEKDIDTVYINFADYPHIDPSHIELREGEVFSHWIKVDSEMTYESDGTFILLPLTEDFIFEADYGQV